jgi:hypothetical protein
MPHKEPIHTRLSRLSASTVATILMDYDSYIQEANEEDEYAEGWRPVCIEEFIDCELRDIIDENVHNLDQYPADTEEATKEIWTKLYGEKLPN